VAAGTAFSKTLGILTDGWRRVLSGIGLHADSSDRRGGLFHTDRFAAGRDPVREAFTQLATALHARTGIALRYALTCTVTRRNLAFIPDVLRWYFADPERTRLWRMLSFQPEADTGRVSQLPISA